MKIALKALSEKNIFLIGCAVIVLAFFILYFRLLIGQEIFSHDSIIWIGSFYYFVESFSHGQFPLWNPNILCGTPFYPDIHGHGLLDPTLLFLLFLMKCLPFSTVTAFTYFYFLRLAIFCIGAYFFFREISGSPLGSLFSAGVLLLSITPPVLRQNGIIEVVFLTPFILFFFLKLVSNAFSPKSFLNFSALCLLVGISANIYLPTYGIFNLVMFAGGWFFFFSRGFFRKLRGIFDFKIASIGFFQLVILICLASPSAVLFFEFHTPDGEHFPFVRIIQKNNGMYPQFFATEIDENVLSGSFSRNQGIFSSVGNILSLVIPDLWRLYSRDLSHFWITKVSNVDFISEAYQYIGIFPLLVSLIGLCVASNKHRLLLFVMMILISLNMISFQGVHLVPFNGAQKLFNKVFPLLQAAEVRETFSGFFLLYLCAFLSIGIKIFLNKLELNELLNNHWRKFLCSVFMLFLFKALVVNYLFSRWFFISYLDLLGFLASLSFILFLWEFKKERVSFQFLIAMLMLVTLADLAFYNFSVGKTALTKNWISKMIDEFSGEIQKRKEQFELFRVPFLPNIELGFAENIFSLKGAYSKGNDHHFFSTKRFYDYFTTVPLFKQHFLSGLSAPILKFFPENQSKFFAKEKMVLNHFVIADQKTFIEKVFISSYPAEITEGKKENFGKFEDYQNITDLRPRVIVDDYNKFQKFYEPWISQMSKIVINQFNSPNNPLKIVSFGPNSLKVKVKNDVNGYLYYNDGYSKFWRAFDNEREIPVQVANYNFKAVFLQKGTHEVDFVYYPWPYLYSLILYYCALFLGSLFIAGAYFYSKSSGDSNGELKKAVL